jgi:hypothetical protein
MIVSLVCGAWTSHGRGGSIANKLAASEPDEVLLPR